MEWKSNLRRTQSLKSIPPSCDKPTWTEAGLWEKKGSVPRLVERYQTTVEVISLHAETKPKQVLKEITPILPETKESHLASLMRRNNEGERSQSKTSITRSKSVGSLQSSAGSIEALKALFESRAATQNKVKSNYRAANFTSSYKAADVTPMMNGVIEEVKGSAEEQKTNILADAPVNDTKIDATENHLTQKMVSQTRTERRKTIGGIDFETIAASEADEKRRSIADFRDSSFIQTKEKLCVSVKAISALYMSKVAHQEKPHSLLKLTQDQSSESGKSVKLTKMAEDSQQRIDDPPPPPLARHQPGPEDIPGAHSEQSTPAQLSKEELYKQRQKCELRRLLKHTHPELKMLDEVVNEELAEVLSSETEVTASETGYEGEVLSRRLIFENCSLGNKTSLYTPKMHMADRTLDGRDVGKTLVVFEKHDERPCDKSVKGIVEEDKEIGSSPDPHKESEEEMIRTDVQATRKIFESQSVKTSRPNSDSMFQGKISLSGDQTGPVQKQKHEFKMSSKEKLHSENKSNACTKSPDLTDQQGPSVHDDGHRTKPKFSDGEEDSFGKSSLEDDAASLSGQEGFEEIIKTSAALFKNNPFISKNIERENSYVHTSKSQIPANSSGAAEDCPLTNVKNRAHLFESMPFDKIRHQNKDEIETLVENIRETLNSLYCVNAIHLDGSIIEVNDTMIAKKAKFTISENGPEIKYDEVAEGGAQNFILQLLPRSNLKPQITYLKEDSKGIMEATVVNVPVHQHQFPTSQDTEFKTANVVQLVEDILNQDNSLRKGVIIQECDTKCAEVIVYSLYNYFDEEDVKSYSAPQGHAADDYEPETENIDISKTENQELRKGIIDSTISCLLETSQDQTCTGSIRPEVTVKGNVKLFKICIEKGDLEYLKTLQAESTVENQELPPNQTVAGQITQLHHEQRGDQVEDNSLEWVPVDVKRLKGMFSGDHRQSQAKHNIPENCAQSTDISHAFTGQTVPLRKSQPSRENNTEVIAHGQRKYTLWECGGQAQEDVCNFAVAPQGSYLHLETQDDDRIHQAELVEVVHYNDEVSNHQTVIPGLQQATIEAKSLYHSSQKKYLVQEPSNEPVVSVTAGDVKNKRTKAELPQENEFQKVDSCTEDPSASNVMNQSTSEHESLRQHDNTETCHEDTNSEEVQTTETCIKKGHEGMDVVQKYPEAMVDSSETTSEQQEEEVVFQGKLQAALDSLERSNINVARGDFKAAMIYRHSSKPHRIRSQNVDVVVEKPVIKEFCPVTEPRSTQVPLRQEVSKEDVTVANAEPQSQSETLNKPATRNVSDKSKRPVGSKPAIPPKPEHLKVKRRDNQSTTKKNPEATQTNTIRPEMNKYSKEETAAQPLTTTSVFCEDEHMKDLCKNNSGADLESYFVDPKGEIIQMSQNMQVRHEVQSSVNNTEKVTYKPEEINATAEAKQPLENPPVKDNMNETDESHVDFHEACLKFGGKKTLSVKNAPVKPKRVKIAKPDNRNAKDTYGDNNSPILIHTDPKPQQTISGPSCNDANTSGKSADGKDGHKREIKQENKVEMREKKGQTETENERRQRLSVHMDEIMRGNITAAMEIFDNLRKQEELQCILSQVEEIEQDTSEADAKSLRRVFENVPDWVVSSDKEEQKKAKVEHREEKSLLRDDPESKSSMANVFGDLERASEEIINLKEQTLARLMDIEEAIKKALFSVSTLKSDSDIAGLSCLFKESLGTAQGSPASGNISKISIGSSRTKSAYAQESPATKGNTALQVQGASNEVASAKQRASSPSSPAFISIQSAARKTDKTDVMPPETKICPMCQHSPKPEEKFWTTKTLTCTSPAQNRKGDPRKGGQKQPVYWPLNPKRELSVLEVQTNHEGHNIIGTKTVTENYEQADNFGNRFYSSKISTVVAAQPETMASSTDQAPVGPATYQVTTYPEIQLPVNQKP